MLEVTANVPAVPAVFDTSDKFEDPSLLVTTEAVTPMLAVLMAPASPESVLMPLPV
jgi:hypothetical protein